MEIQNAIKERGGDIANAAKTVQQDASKNTKNISNKRYTFRETVQYFTEKCTVDERDNKYFETIGVGCV